MSIEVMRARAHRDALSGRSIGVWDLPLRLFHWSLVASFAVAWLSAESWDDLHVWAGYATAALITFRIVWGFAGTHYARFEEFVRGPGETFAYVRRMAEGNEPRYIGHNPAGAIMILALIALITVTAFTGWMYTTDLFWGVDWVEEVHEASASLMLGLVVVHVAGVLYASYRHSENLVRAMIVGTKREGDAAGHGAGRDDGPVS